MFSDSFSYIAVSAFIYRPDKYLLNICIMAVPGLELRGSLLFQSLRCSGMYGEGIMQLLCGRKRAMMGEAREYHGGNWTWDMGSRKSCKGYNTLTK